MRNSLIYHIFSSFVLGAIVVVLLGGCADVATVRYEKLSDADVLSSIGSYSDSSYFSTICCMQYYDGDVYVLDRKRCDIAVLDDSLNLRHTIGRNGRGPNELILPSSFYVYDDTVHVADFGNAGVKRFTKDGKFISTVVLPAGSAGRFSVDDGVYYVPAIKDESLFVTLPCDAETSSVAEFMGVSGSERNGRSRDFGERRSVFAFGGDLYAVPEGLPCLERYDRSGNLLQTLDLSAVEPYRADMKYIERNRQENSYYTLARDCCVFEESLFILCSDWNGTFHTNKIVRVDLPEMSVDCVYELPDDVYDSFCVSDKCFYLFNYGKCSIDAVGFN